MPPLKGQIRSLRGELNHLLGRQGGAVLWEGPSVIDGGPIVVVMTALISKTTPNDKTGDTINTWILRADQGPVEALRSGADRSVCGDCILRP